MKQMLFLEFSCFFYDPTDVGNLFFGSSAFKRPKLKSNSKIVVVDLDLLELANYNMSLAVRKASESFDLNTYFPHFLEAYKDSLKAQGKSPVVSINKIQGIFIEKVNLLNR